MTPLTDAELDDLLGWVDAEHLERAIAELRELRAKVSLFEGREQFSLDDFLAQADEIRELTEQNAALVAALETWEKRHPAHSAIDCDECDNLHAALASVRGES